MSKGFWNTRSMPSVCSCPLSTSRSFALVNPVSPGGDGDAAA